MREMQGLLVIRHQNDRRLHWALPCALAIVLALVCPESGIASATEKSEVEIRIKAAFIYNFARFVVWPNGSAPGPMRIGILGSGQLSTPLEEVVQGKLANGRPIRVTHVNAALDALCCEILLIERSEAGHVREIVQALSGKPILTVCDCEDGFRNGVMIAFQIVDDSVRFQINQEAAERAGLKISSQLLKVALPSTGKHS